MIMIIKLIMILITIMIMIMIMIMIIIIIIRFKGRTSNGPIGISKCWFLRGRENRSTQRKTSRSKGENQQQTQPKYGLYAGI